jgi:hypothetical protein
LKMKEDEKCVCSLLFDWKTTNTTEFYEWTEEEYRFIWKI